MSLLIIPDDVKKQNLICSRSIISKKKIYLNFFRYSLIKSTIKRPTNITFLERVLSGEL